MKDKKSPKENQSRENNKDEVKNNKKYKKHLNKIKKVQQLNFQENISNDTMVLTRRNRCLVFTNLVILNILVNMDHGTIPAATEEISKYLGIDKSTIGLYGSLAFFGALLGIF